MNELLLKIADHITAHPNLYDQATWCSLSGTDYPNEENYTFSDARDDATECGTTACIAGWALFLAPWPNLYDVFRNPNYNVLPAVPIEDRDTDAKIDELLKRIPYDQLGIDHLRAGVELLWPSNPETDAAFAELGLHRVSWFPPIFDGGSDLYYEMKQTYPTKVNTVRLLETMRNAPEDAYAWVDFETADLDGGLEWRITPDAPLLGATPGQMGELLRRIARMDVHEQLKTVSDRRYARRLLTSIVYDVSIDDVPNP